MYRSRLKLEDTKQPNSCNFEFKESDRRRSKPLPGHGSPETSRGSCHPRRAVSQENKIELNVARKRLGLGGSYRFPIISSSSSSFLRSPSVRLITGSGVFWAVSSLGSGLRYSSSSILTMYFLEESLRTSSWGLLSCRCSSSSLTHCSTICLNW